MDDPPRFSVSVGERIRVRRLERALTQDELARRCQTLGFAATRPIIDAVERGARQLELPELLAILATLDLTLEDVLSGVGAVALDSGLSVSAATLLRQALGKRPRWRVTGSGGSFTVDPASGVVAGFGSRGRLQRFLGGYSEPELKAARRLGIPPQALAESAQRLWGKTFTEERDQRLTLNRDTAVSQRRAQALRGHATRALLAEITALIAREQTAGPG